MNADLIVNWLNKNTVQSKTSKSPACWFYSLHESVGRGPKYNNLWIRMTAIKFVISQNRYRRRTCKITRRRKREAYRRRDRLGQLARSHPRPYTPVRRSRDILKDRCTQSHLEIDKSEVGRVFSFTGGWEFYRSLVPVSRMQDHAEQQSVIFVKTGRVCKVKEASVTSFAFPSGTLL